MFGLRTLRARQLSRRGEHAAALAMCDMKDIYVLSRAGMHLSVLERAKGPSIEHALALARTGQTEAALDMAQRFARKPAARTLLGFLATLAPASVMRIIDGRTGLDDISAYCHYTTGNADAIADRTDTLPPVHGLAWALTEGKLPQAKERFHALFTQSGLQTPAAEWLPTGLEFDTLSCNRDSGEGIQDPLISVILTAHNEEQHLATAVNSLLAQSWQNLELIIVNDASTDNTCALAEGLAEKDARIKVVNLERNVGLWAAKNIGLQQCTGEIITMHDADDWSHHRKLELQVQPLLRNEKLKATTSYMVRVDQATGFPYTRNARNYLRWNPSSFMFRASLLEKCGGFQDKLLGSDCEFIARIETLYGAGLHSHLRLPLSIGLQRGGSLSNKFRSGNEGQVRLQHWEQWRRQHAAGQFSGKCS